MDSNIESLFVKRCIKKEHQERLLFELQSKKHREKAFSRFAHSTETILSGFEKIHISDLYIYLSENKTEEFYVISGGQNDGEKLSFKDAIEFLCVSYMVVILISPKIIIIKEENEKSQPLLFVYKNIC